MSDSCNLEEKLREECFNEINENKSFPKQIFSDFFKEVEMWLPGKETLIC